MLYIFFHISASSIITLIIILYIIKLNFNLIQLLFSYTINEKFLLNFILLF